MTSVAEYELKADMLRDIAQHTLDETFNIEAEGYCCDGDARRLARTAGVTVSGTLGALVNLIRGHIVSLAEADELLAMMKERGVSQSGQLACGTRYGLRNFILVGLLPSRCMGKFPTSFARARSLHPEYEAPNAEAQTDLLTLS